MKKMILIGWLPLALAACNAGGGSGLTANHPAGSAPPPPVIQTLTLPRAEIGAVYSEQLAATTDPGTGPVTWSLAAGSAALPGGMTLSSSGLLSGTPAQVGLHELILQADNAAGGAASAAVDLVVYENLFYSYAPDALDSPANDDPATATSLGALGGSAPLVQAGPLSVTSNPAAPDVDWFSFSTPTRGDIHVEVFFNGVVGKLVTGLHAEHHGVLELKRPGIAGTGGNDSLIDLNDAPAATWYLKVEAQYKNLTWYANAYAFRVRFNGLTIASSLVELDTSALQPAQLEAFDAGMPVSSGVWSVTAGSLPPGLTLSAGGLLGGTPAQTGLYNITAAVEANGLLTRREVVIRVFDSTLGNYWQRLGERRLFDSARVNGDGVHHELYCETTVVAPHPDYGAEGAIYVIGGREYDTIAGVHVFHTDHQSNPDRNYKLEDIGRPLGSERQYLGAAFLQHSYGGYIYVVGGELYSNTAPSSGDYTRVVERMQVADSAGVALATPGAWEAVAELPGDTGGRAIEGWAEFGLVAEDAVLDADDRLYLAAGRIRVEDSPASGTYVYEYNTSVLMFEAPLTASASGTWHVKSDVSPYTPRRMPMVGMIGGRIYIIGGRAPSGVSNYIEMYEPDPSGTNIALSQAGSAGFPTLAAPVWYGACGVHNGSIYLLNGWMPQGYMYVATASLQRFTPTGVGTGGQLDSLTPPDAASGYHSAVFHDGAFWMLTGRDPFQPTPRYSLRYDP